MALIKRAAFALTYQAKCVVDGVLTWYLKAQFKRCGKAVRIARPFGVFDPRSLSVGDHTSIGYFTVIYAGGGVEIGAHCWISSHCAIASTGHPRDSVARRQQLFPGAPIRIGDDVWVGAGVKITEGVTIGDRAIIGAGAVVTRDVPAGAVMAGIPARQIGEAS